MMRFSAGALPKHSMSWQAKYLFKLLFQRFVGLVPGLFRLQEWIKQVRNNWEAVVDPEFILSEMHVRMADFRRAGLFPPKVVVEQGTGWHGSDLVMFALAGAQRIETYDTTPWLRAELLGASLRLAPRMASVICRWPGVDEAAVHRRAAELRDLADLELEAQLTGLHCRTIVKRPTERSEIADRSVDLFYSNSVFQRIAPAELEQLIVESQRFLREGGQAFHVIDTKDFHSITDRRVPELGYLRWSRRAWSLVTSRFLNYQNRLRSPEFIALLIAAGLETTITELRITPENLEYAQEYYGADPRYSSMSLEQLAVTQTKVGCRVPATVSAPEPVASTRVEPRVVPAPLPPAEQQPVH